MRILVLGAQGQVGSELARVLASGSHETLHDSQVELVTREDFDLCDGKSIKELLFERKPDFVINAAAFTSVDGAESDADTAFAANFRAVEEVSNYCSQSGSCIIHISTDYVFDGSKSGLYSESDEPRPVTVYGRSKLAGESAIRAAGIKHIILRTSWVFGITGENFVKTMLRLSEVKDEIDVVADQFGAPTSAIQIAETIRHMLSVLRNAAPDDDRWGTYHYSGAPFVSWADFAEQIFESARSLKLIVKAPGVRRIATTGFPTPAQRPLNSRLDCSKLKNHFGIEPNDWRKSLVTMLSDLTKGVQR